MNSHNNNTQGLLNFLTITHHIESLWLFDTEITLVFIDGLNLDKLADGLPLRLPYLQLLDIGNCGFAFPLSSASDDNTICKILFT